MSKNHFPGANITAQYWAGKFVGSTMDTNCACVHTTETSVWPGYSGGASAPHMTIRPNIAAKTVDMRQHYPAGKSSRALVNLAGGVETNTLGVFQIELIGTCDPRYKVSRKEWGKAGVDYIYWPDAPDWLLKAIAPVFKWLDAEWPKFNIADAAPRGWAAYPSSYGLKAPQRMIGAEWRNAYGIFGHQHVPENAHGDPGNFPIAKLVAIATGAVVPPVDPPTPPDPAPQIAVWDLPSTWKIGSTGAAVTKLGQRLVIHARALGLPAPYKEGPGPEFTETDRAAVEAFQRAQGWSGADADGYPGPETFKRLAADPSEPAVVVTIPGLHWNIAGSDTVNGYQDENATRGDDVGRWAKEIGFDVFVACEAGQSNLRAGVDSILGRSWSQHAKAVWSTSRFKSLSATKSYADNLYNYLKSVKYGAGMFGEKSGKKFAVLEIHTDYRKPAKQAKQVQSIFKKFIADTDKLGIPRENVVVCGDFNWDGTSGDNPFKALADWGFVEKGSTNDATFLDGRHLDGVLAHKNAKVAVTRPNRANRAGVKLSDHFPRKFVLTAK